MTNKSKDLDPTTLPGHFARRVHQLAVALFVQEAGDLNLTPWAPEFSSLLARGNLRDTGPYRGLLATWFSRLPFVGLLIDHVLVSPDIGILANRVGADLGSDHLPVIADLTVATEPQ